MMIKEEINNKIKDLTGIDRTELVAKGKESIFLVLNAVKKWLNGEDDIEKKSTLFLLKALGTFIYADGKLQKEEYEFFMDIMSSRNSGINKATLERMLKRDSKDSLINVLMLNELIDNLSKHKDKEIAIVKNALCSLGIIFCSLDGNITNEEMELINFYVTD
jgi:hypothetical protein